MSLAIGNASINVWKQASRSRQIDKKLAKTSTSMAECETKMTE